MDRLWKIELAHDNDPDSITQADIKLYQDSMEAMLKDILLGDREGLIEATSIEYEELMSLLRRAEPIGAIRS